MAGELTTGEIQSRLEGLESQILGDGAVMPVEVRVAQDGSIEEIFGTPITTKGDLIVGDAAGEPVRLRVGADGEVLIADAAEAVGVKWDVVSSGGGADLPPSLEADFYVHPAFVTNVRSGVKVYEADYTPPADCDILVLVAAFKDAGYLSDESLDGRAADKAMFQACFGSSVGYIVIYAYYTPRAGKLRVTLNASTNDVVFLPISLISKSVKPLELQDPVASGSSKGTQYDMSNNTLMTLRRTTPVAINLSVCVVMRYSSAGGVAPAFSYARSGYRVLSDNVGGVGVGTRIPTVEVMLGTSPLTTINDVWVFAGNSGSEALGSAILSAAFSPDA